MDFNRLMHRLFISCFLGEYVPGYVVMPEDAIALDMFLEGQTLESIGEEM